MKFRNGFVSNSSTSSFLIYGVCLDKELAIKLASKLGTGAGEEVDEYGAIDYFESLVKDNAVKLSVRSAGEYSGIYIGRSWSNVGDDETGRQFKDKIEKDILKLLNGECKDIVFTTHEAAWYNG